MRTGPSTTSPFPGSPAPLLSQQQHNPSFISLPTELISLVLGKLNLQSLRIAAATCAHLQAIALPLIWNTPRIPPSTPTQCAGRHEQHLIRNGHLIRTLTFPDPTTIDISLVSPHLRSLLHIDFSGCAAFTISDSHVLAVLKHSPLLLSIDMGDCIDVTDLSLFAVAAHPNVTRMQYVGLARCCEVTDKGVVAMAENTAGLKKVDLTCIPGITGMAVSAIARSCRLLEAFVAKDSEAVTDDALKDLALGCPLLKEVDLDHNTGFTESGLAEFGRLRSGKCASERNVETSSLSVLRLNNVADGAVSDKSLLALLPRQSRPSDRLATLELSMSRTISTLTLQCLALHFPNNLIRLDLSYASAESFAEEDALGHFLASQSNLEHLSLVASREVVTDQTCMQIGRKLHQLRTLDISECRNVSDQGAIELVNLKNLEELNLKGCELITDATASALCLTTRAKPLSMLNLSLCTSITDKAVTQLFETFDLDTLKLSGCFNITDEAFNYKSAEDVQKQLTLLCLSGCYNITDSSLTRLLPNLHRLESINVYACENVTDETMITLARCCPRLASLVISKTRVSDVGIAAIAVPSPHSKPLTSLHTLYAGFLVSQGPSEATVRTLLATLTNLKVLDLSRSPHLADEALMTMPHEPIGKQPTSLNLQVVMMRACDSISMAGAMHIVKRAPKLQRLDVAGCRLLDQAHRDQIQEAIDARW
ncbi:hypothetical protein DFJ77DRAFT_449083 [Powellomyces hirtus]|nr:hypothetical protein DFJ77DRAFT_449083 [Powellomyces hirtus]